MHIYCYPSLLVEPCNIYYDNRHETCKNFEQQAIIGNRTDKTALYVKFANSNLSSYYRNGKIS